MTQDHDSSGEIYIIHDKETHGINQKYVNMTKIQLDAAILEIQYGCHNGLEKFGSLSNSKVLGLRKVL